MAWIEELLTERGMAVLERRSEKGRVEVKKRMREAKRARARVIA